MTRETIGSTPLPNPGSPEAVAMHCKCPRMDNGHGRGFGEPPQFWVVEDCPLHGLKAQEAAGQGVLFP